MTKEETKEKMPDFEPGDVLDIYDKLSSHALALRAFGTLLKSSDLSAFADRELADYINPQKDERAMNLRWGLEQIIELYLAHQESILSEHLDAYHKTDSALIKRARSSISMVEQRAFKSREVAASHLRSTIADLDIVIDRRGDLEEKAHELKGVCLKYIDQLTGKKASSV